jgi:hypothetical protein
MLVLAVGCAGGDGADDTGIAPAFAPMEGAWLVTSGEYEFDTCGGFASGEGMTFTLIDEGAGLWDMDPDAFEEYSCSCVLSGQDLSCAPISQDMVFDDLAVVIHYVWDFGLSFTSETSANFVMDVDAECEGEACVDLAASGMTFPCSVKQVGDVAHTGD